MKKKCTAMDVWGIIYPSLMYTAVMFLVQYAALFVSAFVVGLMNAEQVATMTEMELGTIIVDSLNEELMIITAISGLVTIPLGLLCMYLDTQKDIQLEIYEKFKRTNIFKFLLIIPLGVTSMFMGNYLVSFIQAFLPKAWLAEYDQTAEVLYGDGIGIQILAAVIVAPIIEEIIYRGLVYKRIKRVSNVVVANIISSLIFGIIHLNVVQGIYAFIIGSILAYVYERYKSIVAPIIMHMSANGLSVLVTSLASSEEIQQTQDLVYTASDLIGLAMLTAIMGMFTIGLIVVVHNVVRPQKIEEK